MIKGINNANILIDGGFTRTSLSIEKGFIGSFSHSSGGITIPDELFVLPGFIDKHFHGLSGIDIVTCSPEELLTIPKLLAKEGVTNYLLTITTSVKKDMISCLEKIINCLPLLPGCIGVHLEGPFLSKVKAGAQETRSFMRGTIANWSSFQEFETIIKQVTLAPEECDIDFIDYLSKRGIIISAGHSRLSASQFSKYNSFVSSFTHTYNAMTGLDHRNPGLVLSAFYGEQYCEIIPDLIHVAPVMIKLLYEHNKRLCIVTDAIEAKGLEDGLHYLGSQAVIKNGQKVTTKDGNLAGSVLFMNEGVLNIMNALNITIEEASELASLNAAKCLDVADRIGSIEVNKEANFTIVDSKLNIYMTIMNGRIIYEKGGHSND